MKTNTIQGHQLEIRNKQTGRLIKRVQYTGKGSKQAAHQASYEFLKAKPDAIRCEISTIKA